jgi:hypothetical protein
LRVNRKEYLLCALNYEFHQEHYNELLEQLAAVVLVAFPAKKAVIE